MTPKELNELLESFESQSRSVSQLLSQPMGFAPSRMSTPQSMAQ